jgi:prepilin-type N-terminal cleavage/methylation domain-containing protein
MKITLVQKRKAQAFTLIEMIGVLAVIAILAALLIPKVFEAINNSRINNAAVSYNTVKAALSDHYAKVRHDSIEQWRIDYGWQRYSQNST